MSEPASAAKNGASKYPIITITAETASAVVALPDGCDYVTTLEFADDYMILSRRVITLPQLEKWLRTPKPADRRGPIPALIQPWLALHPLESRRITHRAWMESEVARLRGRGFDAGLLVVNGKGRKPTPTRCAVFVRRGTGTKPEATK